MKKLLLAVVITVSLVLSSFAPALAAETKGTSAQPQKTITRNATKGEKVKRSIKKARKEIKKAKKETKKARKEVRKAGKEIKKTK